MLCHGKKPDTQVMFFKNRLHFWNALNSKCFDYFVFVIDNLKLEDVTRENDLVFI